MQRSDVLVDLSRAAADLGLQELLADVPSSACVRGVFFSQIESFMARRGFAQLTNWSEVLGEQPRSYRFYGLRHVLPAIVKAAAVLRPDAREGLRHLFASFAGDVSKTWYGSTLQKVLRPDPARALRFLESKREYVANFAHWRVETRSRNRVLLHMTDEYIWIDSAHRGGCEGLLVACGVEGEVIPVLDGRYSGHLDIRW